MELDPHNNDFMSKSLVLIKNRDQLQIFLIFKYKILYYSNRAYGKEYENS